MFNLIGTYHSLGAILVFLYLQRTHRVKVIGIGDNNIVLVHGKPLKMILMQGARMAKAMMVSLEVLLKFI